MSDRLTAVGVLQGVEERQGGWHRFSIDLPGKQYPIKLDTKQEDIIAAARSTFGQIATWEYTEREADKINPHTNKPYINRYLESVELGASAEAQQAALDSDVSKISTAGGKDDVDWDAKERRDFRSRAWAHTISAFNHTIPTDADPGETFSRLRPFQQLIYHDIVRGLADEEARDDADVPF